jgi:hypothetical protein
MKLYWRYKKDGKWTWRPCHPDHITKAMVYAALSKDDPDFKMEEEEE